MEHSHASNDNRGLGIKELQSHVKLAHAEIMLHTGFDDDGKKLGKHVRRALEHLDAAHLTHTTGGSASDYQRSIMNAHVLLEKIHDINEDSYGDTDLTEALQEHIGTLY
jgi:hypothetical protein